MKKILSVFMSLVIVLALPEPFLGADRSVSGEITVSCYETMRYKSLLEYAAKVFEEKYPGTKVNVSTFSSMPVIKTTLTDEGAMVAVSEFEPDPKKEEDYVSRLNTEMMSGGGADIIAVDVIPYYKYADAGQLEDLRKYMDSDSEFDYDKYQKNIFDAALYRSGQYILPLDFYFDYLSYDSTMMNEDMQAKFEFGKYTYDELVEMGYDSFLTQLDKDADNPIKLFNLYSSDGDELGGTFFEGLLNAYYNDLIDIANKKADFTNGRFVDMLNTAQEYSEKGYLNKQVNYQEMLREGVNINEIVSQMYSQKSLYKFTNYLMLIYSLIDDEDNLFGDMGIGSTTVDDTLIGMITNDKGESSFSSSYAFAMNSNSKNKSTAWEFLKFLLSDEIQGSMSITFTPVNKNAADQKIKLTIASLIPSSDGVEMAAASAQSTQVSESADNDMDSAVEEYDINASLSEIAGYSYFDSEVNLDDKQQTVFDEYAEYMERYTALLNFYIIRDSVITEMINKEVQSFFNGTKTADEVAAVLQSKVNMYLQE